MKNKLLVALFGLMLMSTVAFAQDATPVPEPTPVPEVAVDVTDTIQVAEAVREGFVYDIQEGKVVNFVGSSFFTYKYLNIVSGLIGSDGIGTSVNFALSQLPLPEDKLTFLKALDYCEIGYAVGYREITVIDVDTDDGDNEFIHGPTFFIKFKF